jgi:hypothetical protein
MDILSVCQCIKVHYIEVLFEECITSTPIVAMGKIELQIFSRFFQYAKGTAFCHFSILKI